VQGNTGIFCGPGCQAEYGNCGPAFQDDTDRSDGTPFDGVGPVIPKRDQQIPGHILIPPSSTQPKGAEHEPDVAHLMMAKSAQTVNAALPVDTA
jgi:hypothetical protein